MKISIKLFLVFILMFCMTFLSYINIYRIPIYLIVLIYLFMSLLFNFNKIKILKIEMTFYYLILIFSFIILLQFFESINFNSLLSLASFLSGLLLVFSISNLIKEKKEIVYILQVYIVFQGFIGIIAIIQAFTGHLYMNNLSGGTLNFWYRPSGVEGMTYNFAKNYILPIVFTFIALKYKLYEFRYFFSKKFFKLLLYYFIFILIISKTRSTQLAFFVISMIYIFSKYRLYKLKYIIIGVFIISMLILFVITHLDLFLDASSLTRFILWYAGLKMFLAHPFFGVGMGMFENIYEKMYITIAWIGNNFDHIVKAPHNLFVGLLSEMGIVGTFIIVYAFYKVLHFVKKYNFYNYELKIISFVVFYYFIIYLIDFQFHNYWNDNYYWFWIGLLFAILKIDKKEKYVETTNKIV